MPDRMAINLTPKSKAILQKLSKNNKIDFRPTMKVIGTGYRKEVKAIFEKQQARTNAERWKPLSEKYAERKLRIHGKQDLLVASGRMKRSMISMGAPGNITLIGKNSGVFGTTVDYATYHDSDKPRNSNLPQRNFSEPSERRADIWKDQIEKEIRRNFEVNGIKVEGAIFR